MTLTLFRATSLLLLLPTLVWGAIGEVTDHSGSGAIERDDGFEILEVEDELGVESMDVVVTEKGKVRIDFIDETRVDITEHSRLVIDDFVYDPASGEGSLSLKAGLGTIRYASGLIAKNSRQRVKITTPSAVVGVRGTDFAMIVDEIGGSMITLLPSCDTNGDCIVGEISVTSDVGQVIMNQAFQSTVVGTAEAKPSKPVILDLTLDQINNLLIIRPPKKKIIALLSDSKKSKNLLDIDFLEFTGLDKNELEEDLFEFNELDINDLDVELLGNILDQIALALAQSELVDGRTSGFNKTTQVNTLVDGNTTRIIRRVGNSTIDLDLNNDHGSTINLTQGGIPVPDITTRDEDASNIITIYQSE